MKKYLFLAIFTLGFLLILGTLQYVQFNDNKLHLIFCDVGQGDGILIRTPSGKVIVVDGGPDEKILGCLGRHLPFWQHTITLMFLSHPHADHLNGLVPTIERYITRYFITEALNNNTAGFAALHELITAKHIPYKTAYSGDVMTITDGVTLRILSPTKQLLHDTSPGGVIGESKEFANLITLVSYKKFHALLVGDSQSAQMETVGERLSTSVDVMQVPHHGSMTGLSKKALMSIRPKLVVISVGKNNYGHPAKYTVRLLTDLDIPVKQTITNGDVEIISNGEGFSLEK